MNALDRVIGWIAPRWGMHRAEARSVMRYYDSVQDHRARAMSRRTNVGPVQENTQNRERLLEDARDLDRNNSFAAGVFNSIVDNVVGRGFRLESRFRSSRNRFLERENRQIEDEWGDWSVSVDSSGNLSFGEVQRLVERELWLAGEVLILRSTAEDNRRIPLSVDVVESERLAPIDEGGRSGNQVIQGVEIAPSGARVAYHLYKEHPSDSNSSIDIIRVPASRVLHLYHPRRPGEVRGISRTAPVARSFQALNQYLDFELTKARIAAAFAMMIKRARGRSGFALPTTGDSNDDTDAEGNDVGQILGGMIMTGGPNDSLETAGPSIQSTAFAEFVTLILRQIAAGLNVSYEILTRDFSKHNFSSIRQSFLEDRRHWEPRQEFIQRRLCMPVWAWFRQVAALNNVAPFPSLQERRSEVAWIAEGWDWIDPLKEKQADVLGVANYLQNIKQVAARHGFDLKQNMEDLAEVQRMAEDLGLPAAEILGSKVATNEPEADQSEAQGTETPEVEPAGAAS